MNSFIPQEKILEQTNGGFDVIKHYFPEANTTKKKFKLRDEKTASAILTQKDNIYFVKDFGDTGKAKTAISIVMDNENLDFHNALIFINDKFCSGSVKGNTDFNLPKPVYEEVEKQNNFSFEFNEKLSQVELNFLGKNLEQKTCDKFNLKSVKSYILPSGHKYSSTEKYPIFCYDFGDWKKLYQPLADKKYKYLHFGEKPEGFIFGMEQLINYYGNEKKTIKENITLDLGESISNYTEEQINKMIDEELAKIQKDTIICSGEKDALNIAQLGYNSLCLNSETATLPKELYADIKHFSKDIYNIPDIDNIGIAMGKKLALQYLDIKTIWLPNSLKHKKDFRGKACKDVTDFLRYFDFFQTLKSVAIPLRFWDKELDKKNKFKRYIFNNNSFYRFLETNGYKKYSDKTNKQGYIYLKIKNKIVEKIEPEKIKSDVKDFINSYLIKHYKPITLRNMIYKSKQTDEGSLSNLRNSNNLDFNTFGKDYQYFFFNNVAWKITAEEIKETKINEVKQFVWSYDIKDKCKVAKHIKEPMFKVNYTEAYLKDNKVSDLDKYEIKINDKDFNFLKYLENTSKMYWKKGNNISLTEQKEQDLHLINKIYSLGYLAHKYKKSSKAWAVFAMDAKESELGKSFGGSGKSICYTAMEYINKQFYLDGRNSRLTKNDFLFDGVDEHTFHVLIDDANQYLDFPFFFSRITGKFGVNPKNTKPFTLPFIDSPKIAITSNFTPRNLDPSTERRLLYTAFSDYYHKKDTDGEYKETVTPNGEFGKELFNDFTDAEWNKFYNFMALCVQVYLKFDEKIEPPMENIHKRNLRTAMGEDFLTWANDYFSNNDNLNITISKKIMFDDFVSTIPKAIGNRQKINKFKDKIKSYCQYRDFIFNPADLTDDTNRIMKKIENKTVEHFFIEVSGMERQDDDMPF